MPLVLSGRAGNEKTAETLVKLCGDVPSDALVHHAIIRGSKATTERLLSANACVGCIPLHFACSGALVKVLVRAKAQINAVDGFGRTALEDARRTRDVGRDLVTVARIKMLQRAAEWARKSRNPPSRLIEPVD